MSELRERSRAKMSAAEAARMQERLTVSNATPEIRETVDYIFEENTHEPS